MYNVVNPDDIVERYGADTLRLYEMFLGPIEQSKPWDTNGIDGVHRFLKNSGIFSSTATNLPLPTANLRKRNSKACTNLSKSKWRHRDILLQYVGKRLYDMCQ